MKQVKITDPTYTMLKNMSPRKDPIGTTAFLEELIQSHYNNNPKKK